MYKYYALPLAGETIDSYTGVARLQDGIFEYYNKKTRLWVVNNELFQIFTGDIECETIDESMVLNIIKRLEV